jgi:hypothetical protein
MKKVLTGFVAALLLLCASIATNVVLLTRDTAPKEEKKDTTPALTLDTDSSIFQGVFLTNGQVYFGKLSLQDANTYKLTNVYYLAEDGTTLTKLGNEPHKPKDAMYIERSQVSFWENLKHANQFGGKLKTDD